jgi:O-antigen/teichoic acid export membrane protein
VSFGPINNAVGRFYSSSAEANALADYVHAARSLILTVSAGVAVTGGLATAVLAMALSRSSAELAGWSLLFAVFSGISGAFDSLQNASRQRAIVAWHQGLGVCLRFGCAVLLTQMLGRAEMAMAGFSLAAGIVLFSQFTFFKRAMLDLTEGNTNAERELRDRMWTYARPFGSWGLFTWAQGASDRWALEFFAPAGGVGLYQALYQVGNYPISMASGFLNQLIAPILYAKSGDCKDTARMKTAYAIIQALFATCAMLTLMGVFFTAIVSTQLFHLLFPPSYGTVAHLLPLVVLASGMFACGQIASFKHMLSPNPKSLVLPKIATAVLGTSLNFLGASTLGITGVAVAGICFSTTYCLWVVVTAPSFKASA